MFQEIPVTEEHIYAFKATGKLTDADYQQFLPRLTTLNHKYGPLSLLIELEDFQGWEPKAAWDDFHYGKEHDNDFKRIALIGEKRWQHWMTALGNIFTRTQIRYFTRDEIQAAWDWLRAADEDEHKKSTTTAITITPYQHIVVAVDFSIYSTAAIRRAVELAGQYKAKLSLIHAIEHMTFEYSDADLVMVPYDFLEQDQQIFDHAKSQLTRIAEKLDVPDVQHDVIWGSPKSSVLSYAEAQNADLIVVGSHGRHGLARLMGSAATGIMHGARCDVTVVKLG